MGTSGNKDGLGKRTTEDTDTGDRRVRREGDRRWCEISIGGTRELDLAEFDEKEIAERSLDRESDREDSRGDGNERRDTETAHRRRNTSREQRRSFEVRVLTSFRLRPSLLRTKQYYRTRLWILPMHSDMEHR